MIVDQLLSKLLFWKKESVYTLSCYVSDSIIRYVVLKELEGSRKVIKKATIPLQPGIVIEGNIFDENAFVDVLRQIKKHTNTTRVYIGLRGTISKNYFFQFLKPLGKTQEEILELLDREIASFVVHKTHHALTTSLVEYTLGEESEGSYPVEISVIDKASADTYSKIFTFIGFEVLSLGSGARAVSRFISSQGKEKHMVVDLDEDETNIYVSQNGSLLHNRNLRGLKSFLVGDLGESVNNHVYQFKKEEGLEETNQEKVKDFMKSLGNEVSKVHFIERAPYSKNRDKRDYELFMIGPYSEIHGVKNGVSRFLSLNASHYPGSAIVPSRFSAPVIRASELSAYAKCLAIINEDKKILLKSGYLN